MVRITPRQIRQLCNLRMRMEIQSHRISSARKLNVKCSDCDELSTCYDHRDYTKPMEIEPVCSRCNTRRGQGYPRLDGQNHIEVDWTNDEISMWLFKFMFKKPREFIVELAQDGSAARVTSIERAPWIDPAVHIKVREVIE